jgi:hypothetical protein
MDIIGSPYRLSSCCNAGAATIHRKLGHIRIVALPHENITQSQPMIFVAEGQIGGEMQTTQALIRAELAHWQQCQTDIKGLLTMPALTVVNESRLKRLQRAVEQQIAKCHAALQEQQMN